MTKQELEIWHSDINNFLNMKIDVNGPDVSEIIFGVKGDLNIYMNNTTRQSDFSPETIIRKEKRFIVIPTWMNPPKGLYIKQDKEHDILIFVECMLYIDIGNNTAKWIEEKRGFCSLHFKSYDEQLEQIYYDYVDICGQTPFVDGMNNCYFYITPVGAKLEVMDYMGGFFHSTKAADYVLTFHNEIEFHMIFEFIKDAFENPDGLTNRLIGKMPYVGKTIECLDKPFDIPEEAKERLEKIENLFMNDLTEIAENVDCISDAIPYVAIIQRINDKMVLRLFAANLIVDGYLEKSKVELMEYLDIVLDDIPCASKLKDSMYTEVIWMDKNTKGTILEYSEFFIRDAEKLIAEYMNLDESYFDLIDDVEQEYEQKHTRIESRYAVAASIEFANSSMLERIYNACAGGQELLDFRSILIHNAAIYSSKEALDTYFGNIDETKTKLNEMLMLPKGFFEKCIEQKGYYTLINFKGIFDYSEKARQYFCRMNNDNLQFLLDNCGCKYKSTSDFCDYVGKLCRLFGYKSWKSYIVYLKSLTKVEWDARINVPDDDNVTMYQEIGYAEYLDILMDMDHRVVKHAKWKLKGDAFLKTYETTKKMYKALLKEKVQNGFKKYSPEWNKWLYETNEYMVVAPKSPEEIAAEGVALNHCAKEFINPVTSGKTALLFIREKGKPDKPFYTLEIKDNKIRQCHGFDNKVVEEDDLKRFVESFCEAKGIPVSYGTGLHGID